MLFSLFYFLSGIINSDCHAQSVRKLIIKDVNNQSCRLQRIHAHNSDIPSASLRGLDLFPCRLQGLTDAAQFGRNNPDNFTILAGDYGRAGNSLYGWALEVNHINLDLTINGNIW